MRDITLGETFYHFFSTRAFATGVPTTLAGTPVLSVLEENNATPITAGVSVSVDRASVAGLNQATIVATSGNGFEAGKSYAIYVSTGTVGGVSVVGEVVGEFTIQASSAFTRLGAPAGASIAADLLVIDNLVDDLESRLGTPSNLGTGATVAANLVDIEGQTDDIGVAGAGLTAVPWNAAWDAEVQSEVDDALVAQNLDHLVGTAVAIPAIVAGTYIDQMMDDGTAAFDRTTDSLQAIRDTAPLGTAMRGTDSAALASVCTEARLSELDAGTPGKAAAEVDLIKTDAAAILVDTGTTLDGRIPAALVAGRMDSNMQAAASAVIAAGTFAAGAVDAAALAADAGTEIADAVKGRTLTEGYAADGVAPTLEQALFMLISRLFENVVAGTTLTVRRLDGATTSMTFTLDDATNPTQITRAT